MFSCYLCYPAWPRCQDVYIDQREREDRHQLKKPSPFQHQMHEQGQKENHKKLCFTLYFSTTSQSGQVGYIWMTLMRHRPVLIISILELSQCNLLQSSLVIFTKIRKAMYFHHVPRGHSQSKDHQLSVSISLTCSSISAAPKPRLRPQLG